MNDSVFKRIVAYFKKDFIPDLFSGIMHPEPYMIFDIFTIIGIIFLSEFLTEIYDTSLGYSYYFLFLFFCFSIFLKQFDPVYLKGLLWFKKSEDPPGQGFITLFVFFMGIFISSYSLGSLSEILNSFSLGILQVPLAIVTLCIYPAVYGAWPFRKARADWIKRIESIHGIVRIPIRIISALGIYGVSLVMEAEVHSFIARGVLEESIHWAVRPFLFPVVMIVFTICYLPVRFHFFIDNAPEDLKSNWAWFLLTIILLSLYSISGIDFLYF